VAATCGGGIDALCALGAAPRLGAVLGRERQPDGPLCHGAGGVHVRSPPRGPHESSGKDPRGSERHAGRRSLGPAPVRPRRTERLGRKVAATGTRALRCPARTPQRVCAERVPHAASRDLRLRCCPRRDLTGDPGRRRPHAGAPSDGVAPRLRRRRDCCPQSCSRYRYRCAGKQRP